MTSRTYKHIQYCRKRKTRKKIGYISYRFPAISEPKNLPPGGNLAIMFPAGPLTHADGTLVQVDPKYTVPRFFASIDPINTNGDNPVTIWSPSEGLFEKSNDVVAFTKWANVNWEDLGHFLPIDSETVGYVPNEEKIIAKNVRQFEIDCVFYGGDKPTPEAIYLYAQGRCMELNFDLKFAEPYKPENVSDISS